MTNEELVQLIRDEVNAADNLQLLYDQNRNFIYKMAKGLRDYVEIDDLMQEGFIGLYEAVKRYESDKEIKFITYAAFWIRRAMMCCIERQGNVISAPSRFKGEIGRYKKFVNKFSLQVGRTPTDNELMYYLDLNQNGLDSIRSYIYSMEQLQSLDEPITNEEGNETGIDVSSGQNMEDEIIDQMMCKDRCCLWDIVKDNTTEQENQVVCLRYKNDMTLRAIGDCVGISAEKARQYHDKAIRRLRKSSIKALLKNKFEIVEAIAYHSGVNRFKTTWTSSTERAVLKLEEMR